MSMTRLFSFLASMSLVISGWPQTTVKKESPNDQIEHLRLEYEWSIDWISGGLRRDWTPNDYADALANPKYRHPVLCVQYIHKFLLPRTVWDERMPFAAQVKDAVMQCQGEKKLVLSTLSAIQMERSVE